MEKQGRLMKQKLDLTAIQFVYIIDILEVCVDYIVSRAPPGIYTYLVVYMDLCGHMLSIDWCRRDVSGGLIHSPITNLLVLCATFVLYLFTDKTSSNEYHIPPSTAVYN